jgi:hypothetical protein
MVLRRSHFAFLSSSELVLLLFLAFAFSIWIRFLMAFVPFRYYESRLGRRGLADYIQTLNSGQERKILLVRQVLYSMGRYVPWARKCLVKALSAKWILQRYGISSTLYFGTQVRRNSAQNKALLAHAWLMAGDRFVTGEKGHKQFTVVNRYS